MIITSYDCGLSRTKIVTTQDGEIVNKEIVEDIPEILKTDGNSGHKTPLRDLPDRIAPSQLARGGCPVTVATGVFAEKIGADIIIPEFEAAAAGLRKLSNENEFTAVLIGTGTPFLRVKGDTYTHIGGTGVGGGTVTGLGALLLGETDFNKIYTLAKSGDSSVLDLMLRDLTSETSDLLPENVTACNFGKEKTEAADKDKAAAIFTLVFQTVFIMAALAAKENDKIVVGGSLSLLPEAVATAKQLGVMHGKTFIFPENREYANAFGAVISAQKIINEKIIKGD
jgi:type II pantothenate kinase